MEYNGALEYLRSFTKFGINLGLERIQEILRRVGNPEKKLEVVHIGGTNGKGSTTAFLAAIWQEGGYPAGTFTSPHLHSYTERFRIRGREIEPTEVGLLIGELRPHLEAMVADGFEAPTEFEVSTAVAFLFFARHQARPVFLEVGLGGRIDSTNVVESPLVTVITNVAMDHMDYLGNTLEDIAREKAAIIKPGRPVVTGVEFLSAWRIIEDRAREMKAPLYLAGRDFTWEIRESRPGRQVFDLQGWWGREEGLEITLTGRHQVKNAAMAVAVTRLLQEQGWALPEEAVRAGLKKAAWPGRLEQVQDSPLVLLDGAHNHDGAVALRRALSEYYGDRRLVLLLGMLGDKEREKVVAELAPLAAAVVITRPNSPRAGEWQELAREVKKYLTEVYLEEEIGAAVEKALSLAGKEDVVCITGSLYMVAEAREVLLKRKQAKND